MGFDYNDHFVLSTLTANFTKTEKFIQWWQPFIVVLFISHQFYRQAKSQLGPSTHISLCETKRETFSNYNLNHCLRKQTYVQVLLLLLFLPVEKQLLLKDTKNLQPIRLFCVSFQSVPHALGNQIKNGQSAYQQKYIYLMLHKLKMVQLVRHMVLVQKQMPQIFLCDKFFTKILWGILKFRLQMSSLFKLLLIFY